MELLKFNEKGQAAITDALFFLLVVSFLCVLMYAYAVPYGESVNEQIARQYRQDYAISALKTILYSSVPRDPALTLDEAEEIDYLLAALKEDYGDDKELSDETKKALARNVYEIMTPFAPSFDYIFYIYLPEEGRFIFVFLYKSEFELTPEGGSGRVTVDTGRDIIYFCSPEELDDVVNFLIKGGRIYQSSSRIQLVNVEIVDNEYDTSTIPAQVNLSMWIATKLDPENLNCTEAEIE